MRCRPMRPRQAVDQAGGGWSRTQPGVPIALARRGGRRAEAQRRTAKAGLLASRGRRGEPQPGKKAGDAVAGPADPARPAEREVRSGRQSRCRRSGTVRMSLGNRRRHHDIASVLSALALSVFVAETPIPAPTDAAGGYGSSRASGDRRQAAGGIGKADRDRAWRPLKRIATRSNAQAISTWNRRRRAVPRRFRGAPDDLSAGRQQRHPVGCRGRTQSDRSRIEDGSSMHERRVRQTEQTLGCGRSVALDRAVESRRGVREGHDNPIAMIAKLGGRFLRDQSGRGFPRPR